MKTRRLTSLFLAIVCLVLLSTSAVQASETASDQIMSWGMDVTLGSGTIDVEFGITGNGIMNKLGCEYIYVYTKNGSDWDDYTYRTEYNTGMSKYNSGTHSNVIYIPCSDDMEYKVVVTVFAENDEGRDSRTRTFFI